MPRAGLSAAFAAAMLLGACTNGPIPPPPRLAVVRARPPFPEPPRFEPATPGEVRGEIARWFTKAGYRDFQVAALVEHAKIESGFRPCAAGAAGLRYTYQWMGGRLQHLYEFAGIRSCPPLDTQLAFADRELRDNANFACFWQTTTATSALAALRRGFGRGSC